MLHSGFVSCLAPHRPACSRYKNVTSLCRLTTTGRWLAARVPVLDDFDLRLTALNLVRFDYGAHVHGPTATGSLPRLRSLSLSRARAANP